MQESVAQVGLSTAVQASVCGLTEPRSQAEQPFDILGVRWTPGEVVGVVIVSPPAQHLQRQHACTQKKNPQHLLSHRFVLCGWREPGAETGLTNSVGRMQVVQALLADWLAVLLILCWERGAD